MHRILIADDDQSCVEKYKRSFTGEGYKVSTAGNGEEVLEKVESIQPHLIILEVMMPRMNGLETLENLKENPKTTDIPVIMLSQIPRNKLVIKEGLELPIYLDKPFTAPEIVVRIANQLINNFNPKSLQKGAL